MFSSAARLLSTVIFDNKLNYAVEHYVYLQNMQIAYVLVTFTQR